MPQSVIGCNFNINKVNEEFLDHAVFICNKTKGKI